MSMQFRPGQKEASPINQGLLDLTSDFTAHSPDEFREGHEYVNRGNEPIAGGDRYTTEELPPLITATFGENADFLYAPSLTAANKIALLGLQLFAGAQGGLVICPKGSELDTDRKGAYKAALGGDDKIVRVPHTDGKIVPATLETAFAYLESLGMQTPRILFLTNPTERGTNYQVDEMKTLVDRAHQLGCKVILDGARIFNTAAALQKSLHELTFDLGIDVVTVGGAKAGAPGGADLVLCTNPLLMGMLQITQKEQALEVTKARYQTAQWLVMLGKEKLDDEETYPINAIRWAQNANSMAARLAAGFKRFPEHITLTSPTEINEVFAIPSLQLLAALEKIVQFKLWDQKTGEIRLTTYWGSTEEQIDQVLAFIQQFVENPEGESFY